MSGADQPHEIDSEGTLRDILADLVSTQAGPSNIHPPASSPPPQADSSWILPPYSPLPPRPPSTVTRLPPSPMPRTSSASRPAQQQIAASTNQSLPSAVGDSASQSASFNTPSRSIFSSGPPTASVSANTAQASLSAAGPSSSSRPLAALSVNGTGSSRRHTSRLYDNTLVPTPLRRGTLRISEKDVDDLSAAQSALQESPRSNKVRTLSKLIADGEEISHSVAKESSSLRAQIYGDASTLSGHLLQRGLIDGRHSDITIHAFGSSYRLHRLLLDRAPFFSSALSGSWAESSASEMTLRPEEVDVNITKAGFELVLKRIYGCYLPADEEQDAIGLFATSSWLDLPNVVDSSVDTLLRQMEPSKLESLIKLVTSNYYGKSGDRILASSKAMLCREGWEMPYEYWDYIPSEILREVVGSDAFFVPGEWERWYLALRLLNRRLKLGAIQAKLLSPNGRCLLPKPTTLGFFAVRFDATYRRDLLVAGRGSADGDEAWIGLYTSAEIAPLLVLLDEGIHYVHLRFEQLQRIRRQKDRFGVPILPEKVISDALWMSMELRQRVVNVPETGMELGISREAEPHEEDFSSSYKVDSTSRKGKRPETHFQPALEMESGSWDGNGKPRKFWIPTRDSSSIMGGASEAYLASTPTPTGVAGPWNAHMSRLSASLEPSDVQWATDFTVGGGVDGRPRTPSRRDNDQNSNPRYSHYPPFRFSAEFPNPRTLKEKKRVYSQTVWYAGSMWNLYIQRVNTSKNPQLGIYLHRAKDRDPSEDPLALLAATTVDDRIGHLEREMLLRRTNNRRHQSWRSSNTTVGAEVDMEDDVTGGSGDPTDIPVEPESPRTRRIGGAGSSANSGMPRRPTVHLARAQKTSQTPDSTLGIAAASSSNTAAASPHHRPHQQETTTSASHDNDSDDGNNNSDDDDGIDDSDEDGNGDTDSSSSSYSSATPHLRNKSRRQQNHKSNSKKADDEDDNNIPISISAIPPYTDARPTIKTYFKIYSPSRAGRMLSVYESAPDKFNFSQSWGWKSSQMVLDDGMAMGMDVGVGGSSGGGGAGVGEARGAGGKVAAAGAAGVTGAVSNGKLRYMVVIGIV